MEGVKKNIVDSKEDKLRTTMKVRGMKQANYEEYKAKKERETRFETSYRNWQIRGFWTVLQLE